MNILLHERQKTCLTLLWRQLFWLIIICLFIILRLYQLHWQPFDLTTISRSLFRGRTISLLPILNESMSLRTANNNLQLMHEAYFQSIAYASSFYSKYVRHCHLFVLIFLSWFDILFLFATQIVLELWRPIHATILQESRLPRNTASPLDLKWQ